MLALEHRLGPVLGDNVGNQIHQSGHILGRGHETDLGNGGA